MIKIITTREIKHNNNKHNYKQQIIKMKINQNKLTFPPCPKPSNNLT